jgi:SNF2 family DNA or RNA helicase
MPMFPRRWGLSGSVASNGLLDLFGVCYSVDLGKALGPYITAYRNKYFFPAGFQGYEWKIRPGADQEIYARLAPMSMRLGAADYLDLPMLVKNTVSIELPPPAMRVYKQMEAALLAQIKEGTVVAANAAAASSKCRQIANGGVYYDDENGGRKISQIHDEKTTALGDLIEELQGNPLLVAYEFLHDLDRIKARLGSLPHIGGGVSAKVGGDIIQRWNQGSIPVLLAHPATLAHGVNLQQVGHHICWYSLPWDLEWYSQMIARIWRQGSTAKRVFVHHIVARNTIDEVIVKVLRQKEKTQTALFDALKALTTEL